MQRIRAIVFDLYGTLFDVHSVAARAEAFFPGRGRELSLLWRRKQLEYTWLRSLMDRYAGFEQVTDDALVFACHALRLPLDETRRQTLGDAYLRLQPFAEVPAALRALNRSGLPLAILSNGSVRSIDQVVRHAGLLGEFAQLISVEEVRVFKPHARAYELGEQRLGLPRSSILFVSSNAWDAAGAHGFGYRVCWIDREGQTFDELGERPDHRVSGVDAIAGLLEAA